VSLVSVLFIILNARVVRHKAVLSSNVQSVVDLPIHFTNFTCRMEETLKDILQNGGRTQGYSETFNGIHDGVDNVWTREKKGRKKIVLVKLFYIYIYPTSPPPH
jgi:hypothetical protein